MPFTSDAILNGVCILLSAGGGAGLGSWLSYRLQLRSQRSLEKERTLAAEHQLNQRALVAGHQLMAYTLEQFSEIIDIQCQMVHPYKDKPLRFLSIPAAPDFDVQQYTLQISECTFLLADKKGRNILHAFLISQKNYIVVLNAWNERSLFDLEKIQPVLGKAEDQNIALLNEADFKKILGIEIFEHAKNSTESCIIGLQKTYSKLVITTCCLVEYLNERFNTNEFKMPYIPDPYGLKLDPEDKLLKSLNIKPNDIWAAMPWLFHQESAANTPSA